MEKEAHQATKQEKEASAATLAKLQTQMALESQAHLSVSEAAKQVSIANITSSNICRKLESVAAVGGLDRRNQKIRLVLLALNNMHVNLK